MNTLTFDETAHEYSIGTRKLPSVTGVLKDCGLIDTRFFNEWAADRGSYVHQACAMLDAGTLDEESLDAALRGFVSGYKKFRAEVNMAWTEIEKPLHDEALGFAGTPDRLGVGLVVDLKCGQKQAWHGIQTSAYGLLAKMPRASRYGLYLHEDGTYKLEQYKSRNDEKVFLSCLTVYNAKRGLIQ